MEYIVKVSVTKDPNEVSKEDIDKVLTLFSAVFGRHLKCTVCEDVMTKPFINICGHNFCGSCLLQDWMQTCPICPHFDIKNAVPNLAMFGLIQVSTAASSNDQSIYSSIKPYFIKHVFAGVRGVETCPGICEVRGHSRCQKKSGRI